MSLDLEAIDGVSTLLLRPFLSPFSFYFSAPSFVPHPFILLSMFILTDSMSMRLPFQREERD